MFRSKSSHQINYFGTIFHDLLILGFLCTVLDSTILNTHITIFITSYHISLIYDIHTPQKYYILLNKYHTTMFLHTYVGNSEERMIKNGSYLTN